MTYRDPTRRQLAEVIGKIGGVGGVAVVGGAVLLDFAFYATGVTLVLIGGGLIVWAVRLFRETMR